MPTLLLKIENSFVLTYKWMLCILATSSALLLGGFNFSVLKIQFLILTPIVFYAFLKKHTTHIWPIGFLLISSFLHIIPWPSKWAFLIQPNLKRYFNDIPTPYLPTSLDPPATAHAVLFLSTLFLFTYAFTFLFKNTKDLRFFCFWLLTSGTSITCLGFVHASLEWWRPYNRFGVYANPFSSSFINPNHFAAYCAVCAFAGLSIYLSESPKKPLSLVLGSICTVGVFCSLSRGSIAAFVFTLCVFIWIYAQKNTSVTKTLAYTFVAIALFYFFLHTTLSHEEAFNEIQTLTQRSLKERLLLSLSTLPIIKDFTFLGIGPEALGNTFFYYSKTPEDSVLSFAENQWLQIFIDHGIFFASASLATLITILWSQKNNLTKDASTLSIMIVWIYIGIHNFFDFNLYMPAVAFPVFALLAFLSHRKKNHANRFILFSTIACIYAFTTYSISIHQKNRKNIELFQTLAKSKDSSEPSFDLLYRSLRISHPADYLIPLNAFYFFSTHNHPQKALKALNTALILAPNSIQPHTEAGLFFLKSGFLNQSFFEIKNVLKKSPNNNQKIFERIVSEKNGFFILFRILETFPKQWNNAIDLLIKNKQYDYVYKNIEHIENINKETLRILYDFFKSKNKETQANAIAHKIASITQDTCEGEFLLLNSVPQENTVKALHSLFKKCKNTQEIAHRIVQYHITQNEPEKALHFIETEQTHTLLFQNPTDYHTTKSFICEKMQDLTCSLQNIARAKDMAPYRTDLWLKMAEIKIKTGNPEDAYDDLKKALYIAENRQEIENMLKNIQQMLQKE